MSFTNDQNVLIALRAGYRCEICGRDVYKSFHAHSATLLHLLRSKTHKTMCEVTNPPGGLLRMRGVLLPTYSFEVFSLGRDDDGFCLCQRCHQRLHNIALFETKMLYPHHTRRYPTPAEMEKATMFFYYRQSF